VCTGCIFEHQEFWQGKAERWRHEHFRGQTAAGMLTLLGGLVVGGGGLETVRVPCLCAYIRVYACLRVCVNMRGYVQGVHVGMLENMYVYVPLYLRVSVEIFSNSKDQQEHSKIVLCTW